MPTYTANKPLKPNVPISIIERDERGNLIGAYNGYWDFSHQLVRLYPDMRHPFVRWRGTPGKKIISDSLVRVDAPAPQKEKSQSTSNVKSQTSRLRKLPLEGQEKMKF